LYNKGMHRPGWLVAVRETTFRSLQHRNYRRYFLGQLVSFIGSWMQSAALMWLMYDRTGDPRWPSWLIVAQIGPTLLLGTWGGGLADRHTKRNLIFFTQAAFLVQAVILTVLLATNLATPLLVLGLTGINGVIQAIDLPARLAFVPDLVPRDDLINAVGLNSLLFNSARAIGPALAAGLFALAAVLTPFWPGSDPVLLGAVACFTLNSLSFIAVLLALRGITVPGQPSTSRTRSRSPWDGFRYLWDQPALGGLVLLTLLLCIFGWPLLTLLPAYTRLHLGQSEQTYSLLVSAVGVGALVGALTTATFGSRQRRKRFLLAGACITTIGLLTVAMAVTISVAALGCAATGFGLILYLSTGQSTLQLAVPDQQRGRVMALWAMTLSASAPLGHILAGQATTVVDVQEVILAMTLGAGMCALVLATGLAIRSERRSERPG
jgi:MFS family permease